MDVFRRQQMDSRNLEIDVDAAARELMDGSHLLLDVREADEWRACHVAEAIHIPLGQLSERIGELPADRPIITICHAGYRSLIAVQILAAADRPGARSVAGGMDAWIASGRPYE